MVCSWRGSYGSHVFSELLYKGLRVRWYVLVYEEFTSMKNSAVTYRKVDRLVLPSGLLRSSFSIGVVRFEVARVKQPGDYISQQFLGCEAFALPFHSTLAGIVMFFYAWYLLRMPVSTIIGTINSRQESMSMLSFFTKTTFEFTVKSGI